VQCVPETVLIVDMDCQSIVCIYVCVLVKFADAVIEFHGVICLLR